MKVSIICMVLKKLYLLYSLRGMAHTSVPSQHTNSKKLPKHLIVICFIFNHITIYEAYMTLCKQGKGCPPLRKVQFFLNIVQKAFDPPPFYLNICPILRGVFFKRVFEH